MASEEDNFDIDIYGDGDNENAASEDVKVEETEEFAVDEGYGDAQAGTNGDVKQAAIKDDEGTMDETDGGAAQDEENQQMSNADPASQEQSNGQGLSPQQGTKRKEAPDDRPIDNGATPAILISDLHWWTTDDDIRGWVNQSECEDELKDITFHEHKVNGKSKGQAFLEFDSPQAASAVKRQIESNEKKKHVVTYAPAGSNPFRTLPKDAPARGKDGPRSQDGRSGSVGYNSPGNPKPPMSFGQNNAGGFRGGRGGGYNRGGGMNNNMGGFQNRNFSAPMGGGPPGGFQGAPMGGFQGAPMGGMQFGGFPNRGGMMGGGMRGGPVGGRGGRGGMGGPNPMMGGMPNMGGMGMGMPGMGGMGGNMGMGMGMQGTTHFNQNFYPPASNTAWNEFHRRLSGIGSAGSPPTIPGYGSASPAQSWRTYPTTPSASSSPAFSTALSRPTLNQDFGHPSTGQAAGFQQQQQQGPSPHYNPNFFNQQSQAQQQGGADGGSWNPHGAKRPRPE